MTQKWVGESIYVIINVYKSVAYSILGNSFQPIGEFGIA